jgi:enolase
MTARITSVTARPIPDSRGHETLEVTLTAGDIIASARVPSGKSAGIHEAKELRDAAGSVAPAIAAVEGEIAQSLIGSSCDLPSIDTILLDLDGTPDKSRLGGNALIGVSMAAARLAARIEDKPLWRYLAELSGSTPGFPRLFMNIVNGGVHAGFRLPFQEYMLVPESSDPREAFAQGEAAFARLEAIITETYGEVPIGDEGGYSPLCTELEDPFKLIMSAAEGERYGMAIDAAASEFLDDGRYTILGSSLTPQELAHDYIRLSQEFPLISIEDPFAEDEPEDFAHLLSALPAGTLVVGDDLTVTNPERVRAMAACNAANAVILKPNQVGTVTQTIEAARIAREAGWKLIVSHRSGDTMGTFVSDLAVGLGSFGIKAGSPLPQERRVKYERLIEIASHELVL